MLRAALPRGRTEWRRFVARAAARTLAFTLLALLVTSGFAWAAGDPTGSPTGTIGDVPASNFAGISAQLES